MSYLTQSASELWDEVVVGLEGEGFAFNPLTTSRPQYLATALGESTAYLTKPVPQLLAELNASFDGPYSQLTSPVAHLLADLGTNIAAGGGGEAYVADGVLFGGDAYLRRADGLVVTDSPQGYLSTFLYIDSSDPGSATFHHNGDQTVMIMASSSDGRVHIELADAAFDNYLTADSDVGAAPLDVWFGIQIAWDTGFAAGDRRLAVYVNRVQKTVTFGDDEGSAFDVGFAGIFNCDVCNRDDFEGVNRWADFGLWLGSTIVDPDSTISAANLNKFLDADGKPVDPTNWPADPLLKFSGDAAGFIVNQGSGGVFVAAGTITDTTSPSD